MVNPSVFGTLFCTLDLQRRWFNHLCPEVKKGAWSEEEDRVIMDSVREYGTRWSYIVKMLPGRTDNAIKNRCARHTLLGFLSQCRALALMGCACYI